MKLTSLWSGLAAAPLVVGLALVPASSQAQPAPDRPARAAAGWGKPVFQDQFRSLSTKRWGNPDRPGGIGTCGAVLTNSAATDKKVLRVFPQPFAKCRLTTGQVFGAGADAGKTYKFSSRLRLPTGTGHYVSFWANGSPYNEIDVVESYGDLAKPREKGCKPGADQVTNTPVFRGIQSNYYSNDAHAGRRHCWTKDQIARFHPFDGRFHTYTVVWNPGTSLTYQVDGNKVASFGKNYAVAGTLALILTDIDNDNGSPNKVGMQVDWVKAWRKG